MSGHKETHRIMLESGETIQRLRDELAAVRKELIEVNKFAGLFAGVAMARLLELKEHSPEGLEKALAAWEEFKKK